MDWRKRAKEIARDLSDYYEKGNYDSPFPKLQEFIADALMEAQNG